MFVVTLNKKKIIKVLAVVVAVSVIGAAGIAIKSVFTSDKETLASVKKLKFATTQDMINYIEDKGYSADAQTAQVREVEIPKKFDKSFENFNEKIKETDGLSLEKYKGDKVDKWTFNLIDYSKDKSAVGVLLIRKEKLIGAYILELPEGKAVAMQKKAETSAQTPPETVL